MSSLFQISFERLCARHPSFADDWQRFETWLLDSPSITEKWDREGDFLLENIRNDGAFEYAPSDYSSEFENFLHQCTTLATAPASTGHEKRQKFLKICQQFSLIGQPIERKNIGNLIYRYVGEYLLGELLKEAGNELLYDKLQDGFYTYEEVLAELFNNGMPNNFSEHTYLHCDASVFATIASSNGLHTASAEDVANRLALPTKCICNYYSERKPLFRISYTPESLDEIRFPTVADAGNYTYFSPTDLPKMTSQDTGLTGPFSDHFSPEPELVHSNQKANIISQPMEWVGFVECQV